MNYKVLYSRKAVAVFAGVSSWPNSAARRARWARWAGGPALAARPPRLVYNLSLTDMRIFVIHCYGFNK